MDTLSPQQQQLLSFKAAIIDGCEDCWIFLVPSSLGEVAAVCALSGAFKTQHGGKILLVTDPSRETVFHMFGDVDLMKFSDLHSLRALTTHGVLDPLKFELGYPQNLWVNQNRCGRSPSLHDLFIHQRGRGGLSFLDPTRYAMNLTWDAPVTKGIIHPSLQAAALELVAAHGLEPGNSVVLFPGNNTNKPATPEFWNALSAGYAKAGKKVFYTLAGSQFKPQGLDIQGVQLNMTPGQAVAVCELAGHMVSGANGLMILALLTESTFSMDVVLTDGQDIVGNQIFTPSEALASSTFRAIPELVENIPRRYKEWVLEGDGSGFVDIANEIARSVDERPT